MRSYDLGDQIAFEAVFRDPATQQPTTAIGLLRLLTPAGDEVTPVIANPSAGVFNCSYTPQISGVWSARWESSGNVQAAAEYKFEVKPTAFTRAP